MRWTGRWVTRDASSG
ncbi:MAG: hypothetical protein ACTH2Q_11795 [Propionibacteriaceae bacterium]